MVDSASINYGLSKISALINQAAPTLQTVSEQYVRFVVIKTVLFFPVMIIALIISIICLVLSIKWIKSDPCDDTFAQICAVFSSIGVLVFTIFSIAACYDFCMALWCPEMFTIHQIISAAKD